MFWTNSNTSVMRERCNFIDIMKNIEITKYLQKKNNLKNIYLITGW